MAQYDGLPTWMHNDLKRADNLRDAARSAALAGDLIRADKLRDEMDAIYQALDMALD